MASKFYRQVALLSSLGVSFAVASAGGFVLGNWLDGRFETRPVLTLIFGLLGVAAAFVNLVRTMKEAERLDDDDDSPAP